MHHPHHSVSSHTSFPCEQALNLLSTASHATHAHDVRRAPK
jgi:hypothetical protein